jgi:hypothetical protein
LRTYKSDHRNPQRLRYGWRLTRSGHIVVDESQRESIFLILALRGGNATLQQICDHLIAEQRPTPRRGSWYCATVKKIIDQNADLYSLLPCVLARVESKWSGIRSVTNGASVAAARRQRDVPRARKTDPRRMHYSNSRDPVV